MSFTIVRNFGNEFETPTKDSNLKFFSVVISSTILNYFWSVNSVSFISTVRVYESLSTFQERAKIFIKAIVIIDLNILKISNPYYKNVI